MHGEEEETELEKVTRAVMCIWKAEVCGIQAEMIM